MPRKHRVTAQGPVQPSPPPPPQHSGLCRNCSPCTATVKLNSHPGRQFLTGKHRLWPPTAPPLSGALGKYLQLSLTWAQRRKTLQSTKGAQGLIVPPAPICNGGPSRNFPSWVSGAILLTLSSQDLGDLNSWQWPCQRTPAPLGKPCSLFSHSLGSPATAVPKAFLLVCVVWILGQISQWRDSLVNLLGVLVRESCPEPVM